MNRLFLLLGLLYGSICYAGEPWVAPDNPSPKAILSEARADKKAGRYQQALLKHLWFHDNALRLSPAMAGVRLSFALSDWLRLGEVYPPALAKLRATYQTTEDRIRDEHQVRVRSQDFHDAAALNRVLRQDERTAELFRWLDRNDPEDAQRLYQFAQSALLQEEDYALCSKYINTERDLYLIKQTASVDAYSPSDAMQRSIGSLFVRRAATLVAILAVNQRFDEAQLVVDDLESFTSDEHLNHELQRALSFALDGVFPN